MSIQTARVRASFNEYRQERPELPTSASDTLDFHRTLPPYEASPLRRLPGLAKELGIGELYVKDEAERFGLKAFKVLGASYAIYRFIRTAWEQKLSEPFDVEEFLNIDVSGMLGEMIFCTATDGNHGRAVAWTARQLKCCAVIYVPGNTVTARIDAIKGEGAEVVVVDGNYDETVKRAANDAETNGWQVIADTAYAGYTEIPAWIMQGYVTLFAEAEEQMSSAPTLVFTQAGVGGMAYAATQYYCRASKTSPKLVSIEPLDADCLLESVLAPNGELAVAKGKQDSIMAGLNCGTPSMLAWPVIRATFDFFIAVDDEYACTAMRKFYQPTAGDPKITSGESGAAGLAGLLALCGESDLASARCDLGMDPDSVVLLINTEGDTDPESFQRIVGKDRRLPLEADNF